jgi:hypothetical protein
MSIRIAQRAPLLALACLLAAGNAAAVLRAANLGLAHGGTTCDGPKATYTYSATWRAGPAAGFTVHTGNQCALGGTVCGISTKDCALRCNAQGACTAQLRACVIGKGSPWVTAVATDGTVCQQITAAPPGKCQ